MIVEKHRWLIRDMVTGDEFNSEGYYVNQEEHDKYGHSSFKLVSKLPDSYGYFKDDEFSTIDKQIEREAE